ncbi:MAG: GspE/PulE family protein [Elusimicrobia bacterium]|nr:GspE/PulE family protein [Elusimicrobiota bacterium]
MVSERLRLDWGTAKDGSWCDLFALETNGPHLKGVEGVYVLWHGGNVPGMVRVGQGEIKERIGFLRQDAAVLKFKEQGLFFTWAKVERQRRDGVERFLSERLQPKLQAPASDGPRIAVNLPGHAEPEAQEVGEAAAAGPAIRLRAAAQPSPPPQESLATPAQPAPATAQPAPAAAQPAPAAAQVEVPRVPRLQQQFNELVAQDQKKPTRSFFGGGEAPKVLSQEAVVSELTQSVMREALLLRASDIHLEPMIDRLRVRLRVDGLLETHLEVPNSLKLSLVSHIRVLCGLDPEKGVNSAKPEDGRMVATVDGQEADLRLATFPTSYGDKAVLRIMPRQTKLPGLEELGLLPAHAALVRQLVHRPQGMIIATGPTGSGKSTTLYTLLQLLNDASRNIVTLEDPIEISLPGLIQGTIQPKLGFGFADGLRAILRQDPNVIMVGEVRDNETAEIACRAALTGHMLLTTLHTPSAVGAVARLLDMGIEPFLLASSLTAALSQRLARRICDGCREAYKPGDDESTQIEALAASAGLQVSASSFPTLYRGRGCPVCRSSGYNGRVLIFEAVPATAELRPLILRKASADELRQAATRGGMEPLLADGLRKVQSGATSLAEVIRVAGSND